MNLTKQAYNLIKRWEAYTNRKATEHEIQMACHFIVKQAADEQEKERTRELRRYLGEEDDER